MNGYVKQRGDERFIYRTEIWRTHSEFDSYRIQTAMLLKFDI